MAPLEIEFFGVTGTSLSMPEVYSGGSPSLAGSMGAGNASMMSKYDLELRVLNDHSKVLKSLRGIEIQSLFGFDMNLGVKTAQAAKNKDGKSHFTGRTLLKITDSHLQL